MVANRIKKLQLEDERLNKQIALANRTSYMADTVNNRRIQDQRAKEAHK